MKRCKVAWQKIVNRYTGLPLEAELNLFQWMIATGWEYRGPERHGVFEWLYDLSGRRAAIYNYEHGFLGCADIPRILPLAFVGMIVDSRPPASVLEWRTANGIGLGQPYKMLPLIDEQYPLYWPELRALFGFVGQTLQVQLNSYWESANLITRVLLTPNQRGWQVILRYKIPEDKYGSSWYENLLSERTPSVAEAVSLATEQLVAWCGGIHENDR
jgi:hypothetical protein